MLKPGGLAMSRLPQDQDSTSQTLLALFSWLLQTLRSPGYALTLVLALQVSMIEPTRAERYEEDDEDPSNRDNHLVSSLARDIRSDRFSIHHNPIAAQDFELAIDDIKPSQFHGQTAFGQYLSGRDKQTSSSVLAKQPDCPTQKLFAGSPLSYIQMKLGAYSQVRTKQVDHDLWHNIWMLGDIEDTNSTLLSKWSKGGELQWAKQLNFTQKGVDSTATQPFALTNQGDAWVTGSVTDQLDSKIGFARINRFGHIEMAKAIQSVSGYGQSITFGCSSQSECGPFYKDDLLLTGFRYNRTQASSSLFLANIDRSGQVKSFHIINDSVNRTKLSTEKTSLFISSPYYNPTIVASNQGQNWFYTLNASHHNPRIVCSGMINSSFSIQSMRQTASQSPVWLVGNHRDAQALSDFSLIKMTPCEGINWGQTIHSHDVSIVANSMHVNEANTKTWVSGQILPDSDNQDGHHFIAQFNDLGSLQQAVKYNINPINSNTPALLTQIPDSALYLGQDTKRVPISQSSTSVISRVLLGVNETIQGDRFTSILDQLQLSDKNVSYESMQTDIETLSGVQDSSIQLATHDLSASSQASSGYNTYWPIFPAPKGVRSQYKMGSLFFGGVYGAQNMGANVLNPRSDYKNWLTYNFSSSEVTSLYPADEHVEVHFQMKVVSSGEKADLWLVPEGSKCSKAQAFMNVEDTYSDDNAIRAIKSDDQNNTYIVRGNYGGILVARYNASGAFDWIKSLSKHASKATSNKVWAQSLALSTDRLVISTIRMADNRARNVADLITMSYEGDLIKVGSMSTYAQAFNDLQVHNDTIWTLQGDAICRLNATSYSGFCSYYTFDKAAPIQRWDSLAFDNDDSLWLAGAQGPTVESASPVLANIDQQLSPRGVYNLNAKQDQLAINTNYHLSVANTPDSVYLMGENSAYQSFIANFDHTGSLQWNQFLNNAVTDKTQDTGANRQIAFAQMPDDSIVTATNWQPSDNANNAILLAHREQDGTLRKAVAMSNNNRNLAVTALHIHQGYFYLGTNQGMFTLPYYDDYFALEPAYWYLPDALWSFQDVTPYTFGLDLQSCRVNASNELEYQTIPNASYVLHNTPNAMRPYPQLAAPKLFQKAPFNESFEVDLLDRASQHHDKVYISLVNANNAYWLDYNPSNWLFYGKPTGDVRGKYKIDYALTYGKRQNALRLHYELTILVPDEPPYYSGPTTIRLYIDGFMSSYVVPNHFFDPEKDPIKHYFLPQTSSSPLWLTIDSETGELKATMISGYQGNYTAKLGAEDPFGAIGWQWVKIVVPNRLPNVTIQSQSVYVGEVLEVALPRIDSDGDRIVIKSIQFNGRSGLPPWVKFSAQAQTLMFNPQSGNQGPKDVSITVEDCFQHPIHQHKQCSDNLVTSSFEVEVPDRDPYVTRSFSSQKIALYEHFLYPIPDHFKDPDGDQLRYQIDNNPDWLEYDNQTKALKAYVSDFAKAAKMLLTPYDEDEYDIIIHALDGYGGQTQAPLKLKLYLTTALIKKFWLITLTMAALGGFFYGMWRRSGKFQSRQQHITDLLNKALLTDDFYEVCPTPSTEELIEQSDHLKTGLNKLEYDHQSKFLTWAQQLHRYYRQAHDPKLVTGFVFNDQFITRLSQRLHYDNKPERFEATGSSAIASLLYDSTFLLLAYHSARGYQLSINDKKEAVGQINNLLSPRKNCCCGGSNLDEVMTLHQVLCARQALLYTHDNETKKDLVLSIVGEVLSLNFVGILKAAYYIWHEKPEEWFASLIRLWKFRTSIQLGHMSDNQQDIEYYQKEAYEETNWAFRLGLVDIYIDLIERYSKNTDNYRGLINQLIRGGDRQLGLKDLLFEPKKGGSMANQAREYLSSGYHEGQQEQQNSDTVNSYCLYLRPKKAWRAIKSWFRQDSEKQCIKRYAWARVESLESDKKNLIKQAVQMPTDESQSELQLNGAWALPSDQLFTYGNNPHFGELDIALRPQADSVSSSTSQDSDNINSIDNCCQRFVHIISTCWRGDASHSVDIEMPLLNAEPNVANDRENKCSV